MTNIATPKFCLKIKVSAEIIPIKKTTRGLFLLFSPSKKRTPVHSAPVKQSMTGQTKLICPGPQKT